MVFKVTGFGEIVMRVCMMKRRFRILGKFEVFWVSGEEIRWRRFERLKGSSSSKGVSGILEVMGEDRL